MTSCMPAPTSRPSPPTPTVVKSPSATPVMSMGPIAVPSPTPQPSHTSAPNALRTPTFTLTPIPTHTSTVTLQPSSSSECQHARISRVEPLDYGKDVTIFGAVYDFDKPGISEFQWFQVEFHAGVAPPVTGPNWQIVTGPQSHQVGSKNTDNILVIWDAKKAETYPQAPGIYTLRIIVMYHTQKNGQEKFILDKDCWRQITLRY